MSNKKEDLLKSVKEVFDNISNQNVSESIPEEAMSLGTLVRSLRHDKLGIITDAYYGALDADDQKVIIYTLFLFPKNLLSSAKFDNKEQFYLSNEFEYDVVGYLMIPPVNIDRLFNQLGSIPL